VEPAVAVVDAAAEAVVIAIAATVVIAATVGEPTQQLTPVFRRARAAHETQDAKRSALPNVCQRVGKRWELDFLTRTGATRRSPARANEATS
jgi:hypothetical protein